MNTVTLPAPVEAEPKPPTVLRAAADAALIEYTGYNAGSRTKPAQFLFTDRSEGRAHGATFSIPVAGASVKSFAEAFGAMHAAFAREDAEARWEEDFANAEYDRNR